MNLSIVFVTDIKHADTGEFLEQNALPSITGLPASAPMLPGPAPPYR